jgi:ACS family tartrate transporter-like MFS transporter
MTLDAFTAALAERLRRRGVEFRAAELEAFAAGLSPPAEGAPDLEALATRFVEASRAYAARAEAAVLRRVSLRLLPFLFLLYVVNILDRTNIGFAALQMLPQLHMSGPEYGFAAGLFYVGYFLFEVPSNLILRRTGARVWFSRILVSWGLVSAATMFVTGPWGFGVLRVLLGVAEAGFFPGIILYLSYWFPMRERARATAVFMAAGPVAAIVGNPMSGAILQFMDRTGGLAGWQWVFLLEGLPAVALGIVTLYYLTDRPAEANWLSPSERTWLAERMEAEEAGRERQHGQSMLRALADPRLWLLIAVYFTVALGDNAFGFYLPRLLDDRFPGWPRALLGLLAALPSVAAIAGMVAFGASSDRSGERRRHVAVPAFLAAAGWTTVALAPSPWLAVFGLALASLGMKSMLPTFWTLPTSFLSGAAAAAGIALINSVANLGGLVGPNVMGLSEKYTGGFAAGSLVMAAALCVGGGLVLCLRRDPAAERGTAAGH